MPDPNDNNSQGNSVGVNTGAETPVSANANAGAAGSSPATGQGSTSPSQGSEPIKVPVQRFPEPKVIEAVVDPKQKPKDGPVAFSFTKPQAIQQQYSEPSKGDVARSEEKASDNRSDAQKLADLDAEIARDEKRDQPHGYSDYHDTAEMGILMWEATLMFFGRLISKDTSDTAYGFSKETREKLIYQGTKVSRKRNWVIPIEYMFAGTIVPASASILLKAKDRRTQYFKDNPPDKEPILNKGGPHKGQPKKRGPGRPRI